MLSTPNPQTVVGFNLGWSFTGLVPSAVVILGSTVEGCGPLPTVGPVLGLGGSSEVEVLMFPRGLSNVSARTVVAGFPTGTLVLPSFRAIRRTFPFSRKPVTPEVSVRDSGCAALGPGVEALTPSGRGTTDVGTGTVVPGVGTRYTSGRPGVATDVAAHSFLNRALVRSRADFRISDFHFRMDFKISILVNTPEFIVRYKIAIYRALQ